MDDQNSFYESERKLELNTFDAKESIGRYTAKTFLIMFLGLAVTFATALYLAGTYSGLMLVVRAIYATNGYIHLILAIAEIAVTIGMTAMLHKLSVTGAGVCFFLYAFLTGLTFSILFLVYEMASAIFAFALAGLFFAGMAIFGYLTDMDLARIRPILVGGLFVLIIANLVMYFLPIFEVADQVICTIGLVIFLGYTAYDTQKIRTYYDAFSGDEAMRSKMAIFSALQLYLDFINMFLYILRLLGKRSRR